MKLRHTFLMVALLAAAAGPAQAACKEKRSRDVSFVELAVPEGAIRPAGCWVSSLSSARQAGSFCSFEGA